MLSISLLTAPPFPRFWGQSKKDQWLRTRHPSPARLGPSLEFRGHTQASVESATWGTGVPAGLTPKTRGRMKWAEAVPPATRGIWGHGGGAHPGTPPSVNQATQFTQAWGPMGNLTSFFTSFPLALALFLLAAAGELV